MSDTTNDAAFEDAYRSGALLREALRNLGQANHDEGPPLWRGLITATIPPQDPMDKPTERAPLLSKEWIHKMRAIMLPSEHRESTLYAYEMGAMDVLGAIEAKITSGELRVVKKAAWTPVGDHALYFVCGACSVKFMAMEHSPNFCPGCGAQIVK